MKLKTIYVHHSADNQKEPQFWKVNNYHKQKFREKSNLGYFVGYNKFIERDGTIMTARQDGEMTVAQKGDNFEALSVCLAGNMNEEYLTKSQEIALLSVLNAWMDKYAISLENVRLHRDLNNYTECPGKNVTIEYVRNLIKKEEEKVVLLQKQITLWKKIVAILKRLINKV